MKPKHGDLVKVMWIDPRSDASWIEKNDEDLTPALCTNVGYFNYIKEGNLYLYASYHDDSIGDRIVIPYRLVKEMKKLNDRHQPAKRLHKR